MGGNAVMGSLNVPRNATCDHEPGARSSSSARTKPFAQSWNSALLQRFMESPLFLFDLLTGHEPVGGASVLASRGETLAKARGYARPTQRFMESTGHWPVPDGDSPDGTATTLRLRKDEAFLDFASLVSVGGSPALPVFQTRSETRGLATRQTWLKGCPGFRFLLSAFCFPP